MKPLVVCFVLPRYLLPKRWNVKLASIFVVITCLYKQTGSELEEKLIEASTDSDCICPGDIVTYECTVTGDYGGLTLWKGDFFNCESHEQDIELRHDREINDVRGGDAKICNDGNIAARIVRTVNGSFISQLDITLTSDIAGKTIGCAYDNGTAEHRVGSLRITKDVVATYLHPENISFTPFCLLPEPEMHFNWDAFPLNCPALHIHYNILASNCGSCPTTTNYTNVACRSTDGPVIDHCIFSVQSVVSLKSAICYSEWQNTSLKIRGCPGENGFQTLLLAVIPPLTILLLLLAILVPLSIHKCALNKINCNSSCTCQKQETREYSRKSQAEGDAKEVTKIFLVVNGMYNLEEPDTIQSEIQESIQGGSTLLSLNTLLIKLEGKVSSHWYKFGQAVGIPEDILEQLKNYSDKDALVEILDYWLKNHSYQPTWQDVATALKETGFNDLNIE